MSRSWPWWLLAGLALTWALAQRPEGSEPSVNRGQYLAQRVALCVECHSPRDAQGQLIRSELFRGAAVPVRSPYRAQQWALQAPNIAGLTGFTDEQIQQLLTSGQIPGRPPPLPPMPAFRLRAEDAQAIIAYLRTL